VSLDRHVELQRRVRRWLSTLGFIALVAILLEPKLVHKDQRWLLTINGEPIDVAGTAAEIWGRMVSDCSVVTSLSTDTVEGRLSLELLRRYSPPDSESARLVRIDSARGWLFVEAGFETLPPVLALIRQDPLQPVTATIKAVWSGTSYPWRLVPFAAAFLSARAPDAPTELLLCAKPSFQ
jgi:hypothetical protein